MPIIKEGTQGLNQKWMCIWFFRSNLDVLSNLLLALSTSDATEIQNNTLSIKTFSRLFIENAQDQPAESQGYIDLYLYVWFPWQ